jgi:hypothetical protein
MRSPLGVAEIHVEQPGGCFRRGHSPPALSLALDVACVWGRLPPEDQLVLCWAWPVAVLLWRDNIAHWPDDVDGWYYHSSRTMHFSAGKRKGKSAAYRRAVVAHELAHVWCRVRVGRHGEAEAEAVAARWGFPDVEE